MLWEFVIAWRFAAWPTNRSPALVNATIEGVVRIPSALGITTGSPPSITDIHEFVVPKSIPNTFAIIQLLSHYGKCDILFISKGTSSI